MLFDLAEDLLVDVLSNWLEDKAFAKFDSSLCNTEKRGQYFRLINNSNICLNISCKLGYGVDMRYIRWLNLRNLHCKEMLLNFSKLSMADFDVISVGIQKFLLKLELYDCDKVFLTGFDTVMDQFTSLLSLCINNYSFLTISNIQSIAVSCPKVKCLTFDNTALPDNSLLCILREYKNLSKLEIRSDMTVDISAVENEMSSFASKLERIEFTFCTITDVAFRVICQSSPQLKELICWHVLIAKFDWLGIYCKQLSNLELCGVINAQAETSLITTLSLLNSLTDVNIDSNIDYDVVDAIALHNHHLKCVDIVSIVNLFRNGSTTLFQRCPMLTKIHLKVSGFDNVSVVLISIMKHCKYLTDVLVFSEVKQNVNVEIVALCQCFGH